MNHRKLSSLLTEAAGYKNLDPKTIARRLDVSEDRVASALANLEDCSVTLLIEIAGILELELTLCPAPPTVRRAGAVPSLVDNAVAAVVPELVAPAIGPDGHDRSSDPA